MKKKSAVIVLLFCVLIMTVSFAATAKYPTIMNNLNTTLKKIQEWLVTIATPAAC